MRKQIFSFILLLILINFSLQSCKQKENKTSQEHLSQTKTEIKTDSMTFKSLLKPDENLELGKLYTDQVEFIKFDDNGDDFYFFVKKNKDTIGLIYNKDNPQITRGSTLEIKWKMDSLRPAGDPEYLDFTEYLVSWKTIKTNNKQKDFLKLKNGGFVLSCGTGCAMTHNVKTIKQINPKAIKVTFEVENYINEELSETFEDSYIFYYDDSNKLKKVSREGENENLLETFYMGGAKQSFEEFGAKLME